MEDKYFVGFFEKGRMVAIMDLIDGYPEEKILFIGLFMTDGGVQNKGVGSAIISELTDYLKSINYIAIRLACIVCFLLNSCVPVTSIDYLS